MANELKNPSSYVTVSGLSEFLTQIKSKYAANTADSYAVNHAAQAGKLATERTISFAKGDVTGSFNFDGSANVSDVALTIGAGKVTNAMLAGSIEQSKISGLTDALGGKVDKETDKGLSTNDFTTAEKEKLAGMEAGGQVNVIETVKVNGSALTVTDKAVDVLVAEGATNGTIAVNGTDVAVHGLGAAAYEAKTAFTSASKGEELEGRIESLEARGRFLSTWNCSTGLPGTNPPASAMTDNKYNYKAGDYYVVGTVSSATPAVNYKPNGSYYEKDVPSTTVESGNVAVGDFYLYDGSKWVLLENTQKSITISQVIGLQDALDGKLAASATVNGKGFTDGAAVVDGADIALTGYAKGSSADAIAATDTINAAFGKVENQIDAKASSTDLASHTGDSDIHVTAEKKTAWDAKYDKPTTGIPKTDLADAVQGSLGKADTAVQSVTTGATDGTIAVDGTDVAVKGLGGAAYKAADYYVQAEANKRLMTSDEGTKLAGIDAGAQVNKIEAIKITDSSTALTITDKTVVLPAASASADGIMSSEDFSKLSGISTGANKVEASTNGKIKIDGTDTTVYTHPSNTEYASGLYKITVDALGHVSAATAAAYADLPITKANLDGTIGNASASAAGLMTAAHFSKVDALTAATNDDIDSIFA